MSYGKFACYYDKLTYNVDYKKIADYYLEILKKQNHAPGLTLDLACGTGSLTIELAKRGIDVFGVDGSFEMLSLANQKACESNLEILFLRQQMQNLNLYGTVDTVFCTLDSINHLTNYDDVVETFKKVSLFLNPEGYFIFDMNTIYKHKNILSNNVFIYDLEDVYCVWQNSFNKDSNVANMDLEFFERDGNIYYRSSDKISERAYSENDIKKALNKNNLNVVCEYEYESFSPVRDVSHKIVYVTKKISK